MSQTFYPRLWDTNFSVKLSSRVLENSDFFLIVDTQLNAENGERQVWYSHGCLGEPVFVPRRGYDSWREGDEDDGYVIVQVYIPEKHLTEFCVVDAKDVGKGPLARIKLKHHVPYGFHGTFTPEVFRNGPRLIAKL